MNIFEWIAEEKITEAMAAGRFDHLENNGQPLSPVEECGIAEEHRLTHHILKNNGFTFPWVELQREIQTAIAAAQESFRLDYLPGQDPFSNQRAVNLFREKLQHINLQIKHYNMQVPLPALQYYPLDLDKEVQTCLDKINANNQQLKGNA